MQNLNRLLPTLLHETEDAQNQRIFAVLLGI